IAIVNMSDISTQPSLFYHLGVRESFDIVNNVILYHDTDSNITLSLKVCSGNYYFIPYIVTPSAEYLCCETDAQWQATEYMQPNGEYFLAPVCISLVDKFINLIRNIHVTSRASHKENLLNDIRKARMKYQGNELAKELGMIKLRMDNIEVMTSDVIINLLLSYRDIQDYDAMVKLVETLEMLPMCDVAYQHNIKFYYAFAMNRRNSIGDRERALHVLLHVLQTCEQPAPDMLCLCGRIYKDIFLDSEYEDDISRDKAIAWYYRGFHLQPSLYSGTNLAILLILAGQHFETSMELQKIGTQLNSLLARKGSLENMNNYWDVSQVIIITILGNNIEKAIQAAERLFRMKPPVWYLRSIIQNLFIIQNIKKFVIDCSPKREQFNFWLDILFETTIEVTDGFRFPVLVIEPTGVYQPSYVSINSEAEERTVYLCYVSPTEMVKNKSNPNGQHLCDIYCCRFYCFVREMLTDSVDATMEPERETSGDTFDFEYDHDANGKRIVLGKGTYGIVYAGQKLSNQGQIAIKEIPERDRRQVVGFHILYLISSSVSEGGFIKIFMEQVSGGDLSALLQYKWGPMQEHAIKFYTKQILKGLKYLHENQIVHRDIKGNNVLVSTCNKVVKISDCGTFRHIERVNPCRDTSTDILQYMAPEITDEEPDGYGTPADIWSLGCIIIEMATSRPPIRELAETQSAMFQMGLSKSHPEIPRTLSFKARAFILSCFEPNPSRRVTAADLLKEDFLKQTNKGRKRRTAFSPSEDVQCVTDTLTAPSLRVCTGSGSSSSEHDSISPDSDAQQDIFTDNAHVCNYQPSHLLSVPHESSALEDQGAASFPDDRDLGILLLNNDYQRRALLYKILWDEQTQMASILQECVAQSSQQMHISDAHIKQVIGILRNFIYAPNHRMMASMISKLKMDLDCDSIRISQIHLILSGFQDAVNKILRNHLISPRWIFAMGDILRRAVQAAVTTLSPEFRAHFEPAFEMQVDKGMDKMRDCSVAQLPGEVHVTARRSRLGSMVMQEASPHQLYLTMLREEADRILGHLVQREREFQNQMWLSLEQKAQELHHLQVQQRCNGDTCSAIPAPAQSQSTDEELTAWLQQLQVDADTIEKIVKEGYTLSDILDHISKEDLKSLQLRGGVLCRIWHAIVKHRKQ
uniref:mitogen-activated protein kinase kinase kinase n=1 Tax=Cavia porcellus TaxID=10141 RepID=H0VIF4_CAVPO